MKKGPTEQHSGGGKFVVYCAGRSLAVLSWIGSYVPPIVILKKQVFNGYFLEILENVGVEKSHGKI